MRILIIEDNTEIAGNMADFLNSRSHVVDFTTQGRHGLRMLEQQEYDVIVLDLMLPDIDGTALCRGLRANHEYGHLPVLMLTARDRLEDKLTGFEAGADDYLVKPFSLLELEARLKALYQRRSTHGRSRMLTFSDITYNLNTMEVRRAGRAVSLSSTQRAILRVLLRADGNVVSRSELTQALWGDDPPNADALSVHMHTLRQALHAEGESPVLSTVRGEGYRLAEPA